MERDRKWKYTEALRDKADAERAEMRRRAALFPKLMEALKLAQQIIGHPDDAHSKLIAAAIAKAEGK